mgnify:CR=1 FL=1
MAPGSRAAAPGDVTPRSDASGHPINRAFADLAYDKPVIEPAEQIAQLQRMIPIYREKGELHHVERRRLDEQVAARSSVDVDGAHRGAVEAQVGERGQRGVEGAGKVRGV